MPPLAVAVLVGVALLFVGLIGLTVYQSLVVKPRARGQRWAQLAAALSFELEPHALARRDGRVPPPPEGSDRMLGSLAGWPVRIQIIDQGGGHEGGQRPIKATKVVVALPHSLELGLHLHTALGSGITKRYTVRDGYVVTGDPAVDEHFVSFGNDREQIAALLRAPALRGVLVQIRDARLAATLEDEHVSLAVDAHCYEADELRRLSGLAIELARALLTARGELGGPQIDVAMEAAMTAVAAKWGMHLAPDRLAIRGQVDGASVEAAVVKPGRRRETHFVGHFERPLGLALRLRRQTSLFKLDAILGGQDIETGDQAFDARFVLQGAPEHAVRAALGPELRKLLCDLQDTVELRVEDQGVLARVAHVVHEPAALEGGLRSMAAVVNALRAGRP